jgi:hypothetical protein
MINGAAFPHYGDDDWLRFAHHLFREGAAPIPGLHPCTKGRPPGAGAFDLPGR